MHLHAGLPRNSLSGSVRDASQSHANMPQVLACARSPLPECAWRCLFWRRKCEGHEDAVRVLAVAAGKVFSGSYDGTIGVW